MSRRISARVLGPTLVALLLLVLSGTALAQSGRVGGTVKGESGEPIKGATVVAENTAASPSSFSAVTDDKGRFSMIGLKAGIWQFTASAPGFQAQGGEMRIATLGTNPPVAFSLPKGIPSGPSGALAGVNTQELQDELQAAEALMSTGKYDDAIGAYRAIIQKTPTLTAINFEIGRAYRIKKDYDSAMKAYQAILETDPFNERAKIAIGMTHLEKGEIEAADTALTAVAEVPGASREVFYNLGEVKAQRGDADTASKWYQKAADVDPTWGRPYLKLGLVAVKKGDAANAAKWLEKVLEMEDPSSQDAVQAKTALGQLKK